MSHVPLFQTQCLHSRHLVSSSFLLAPNLYCLTHVPRNSKSFSEPLKDKSVQIHAACSVLHPAILQNLHELLRRTNRTMQTSTDFGKGLPFDVGVLELDQNSVPGKSVRGSGFWNAVEALLQC